MALDLRVVSKVFTLFEVNPTALLFLLEYASIDGYIEMSILKFIFFTPDSRLRIEG